MKIYKLFLALAVLMISCSKKDNFEVPSEWINISSPILSGKILTDVEFLDDEFGVVSGGNGILVKTNDGGQTWVNLNVGTNHSFLKTFVLNQNEFFISRNKIYKTNDKGESFDVLGDFSDSGGSISSMYFFDSNEGVINKGSNLYKTSDGSQTWNLVYNQAEFANKIVFISNNIGFFFGGKTNGYESVGELYKTFDGGSNWEKINISTSDITSMYFLNANVGFASNYENQVLKTQDGGIKWEVITLLNQPIYDLIFIDDYTGYAISSHVIYLTKDSGQTWVKDYENAYMTFTSITSAPNKIVVIGNNGVILKKNKK